MCSGKKLSKNLPSLDRFHLAILSLLLLSLLLVSSYIITCHYTSLAFTASFVQSDKKSYLPGEDINIRGKINQLIPEEKNVRIDIYDPKGGLAIGNINEPLDEKNEFVHTINGNIWTTKFEPGKYTILVTYNRETASQGELIIVTKGHIPS